MISVREHIKAKIEADWSKEDRNRYKEALARLSRTPNGRREIAEIVISDITKKYQMVDIAELLGVSKDFEPGQDPRFRTKRGLRGTIHAHGSYAERTQWTTEWVSLTTDLLSVNPEALLIDLQAGRIGTLSDLQADALEAAKNTMGQFIFSTVQAGITSGVGTCSTSDWSAANSTAVSSLKTAIRYVADRGGVQAVVGRYSTLVSIADMDHGYDQAATEEIRLKGLLGYYNGAPLVYLDRVEDRNETQLIPEDVIIVVPKKLGVVTGYVGDFEVQEGLDKDTLIFSLHIYRSVGVALLHEDRVYKLSIT